MPSVVGLPVSGSEPKGETPMHRFIRLLPALAIAVCSAAFSSCDSADTAFDCQSVCSRYRDCYDPNYNVGQCRESCRARAANDPNVKGAADTCEACIGGMSFSTSTLRRSRQFTRC